MTTMTGIRTTTDRFAIRATAGALALAAGLFASGVQSADAGEIDLVYVWTAKPGMEEQLIATYGAVGDVLEAHEPGLLTYEIAVSETGNQIVIHEVFEDEAALAFHLSSTAAQYFPQIAEIAVPGPFIFRGDVPEELKMAAYQMEMGAIFTGDWDGFSR